MRISIFLFFIISLTACTNTGTVIEGSLPSDKYDKQTVYWVPMEGASSKTVDSAQINKHNFRLVITPHNYNKMGIIRLHYLLRWDIQELLVFTEKGKTVHVNLDSISSATGTPLNEALQNWKDGKMLYDKEAYVLQKKYNNASPNDTTGIKEAFENLSALYRDDVFKIVAGNKDNEIGKFIYSVNKNLFTPDQIQNLNLEKKETTKSEK